MSVGSVRSGKLSLPMEESKGERLPSQNVTALATRALSNVRLPPLSRSFPEISPPPLIQLTESDRMIYHHLESSRALMEKALSHQTDARLADSFLQEAGQNLNKACSIDGGSPYIKSESQHKRADYLFHIGDYRGATESILRALTLCPKNLQIQMKTLMDHLVEYLEKMLSLSTYERSRDIDVINRSLRWILPSINDFVRALALIKMGELLTFGAEKRNLVGAHRAFLEAFMMLIKDPVQKETILSKLVDVLGVEKELDIYASMPKSSPQKIKHRNMEIQINLGLGKLLEKSGDLTRATNAYLEARELAETLAPSEKKTKILIQALKGIASTLMARAEKGEVDFRFSIDSYKKILELELDARKRGAIETLLADAKIKHDTFKASLLPF